MFDPKRLAELAAASPPAALCTVVETQGSTPRKIGASMVVIADGTELGAIEGTIGGGAVEHQVRQEALLAIAATRPRRVDFALTAQLGMCCGGTMGFLIEPLRTKPPCIIFGAGHVGSALAELAHLLGFAVWIADPRDELRAPERFPTGVQLVSEYEAEDLSRLPFGPDAFVVVVTHDHRIDQELAEAVLRRDFRYAALVASERKAAMTRKRCAAKGLAPQQIARLQTPAGIDIGAETPAEIALSIVASMVQVRRQQTEAQAPATLDLAARQTGSNEC